MKIGVIGSGFVGSTAAYAMVMRGVGRKIVLIDLNKERAKAEANDILHAVPFAQPMEVLSGDYPDLEGCKVVIITAGVSQKPGETRLELLDRNAKVFKNIIPSVLEHAPDAILLVATNPVDVMTHIAAYYAKKFGSSPKHIIGSGTTLDTARFRALLGARLGIDPQHIHAYVIGEHGDSELLAWSQVTIGGIPIDEFCEHRHLSLCEEDYQEIDQNVRQAAYQIIDGKGATYYGIGSAIARIVEVILRDQRSILTICAPMEQVSGVKEVTLSLPNLLGGDGIITTFLPMLEPDEEQALKRSAITIRQAIDSLHLD